MALEIFGNEGIKILAIVLELINIGLLSGLLYLYIKSYRQIKIGFTVGLILFASILLIKSILSSVFILFVFDQIARPIIVLSIIQLVALGILLKITLDY
jgi:hypothetical protein